jgi:hypothetical protein
MIDFSKITTLGQFSEALINQVHNQDDMNRFIEGYRESEKDNLSVREIFQNMDFVLSYFFSDNQRYQEMYNFLQNYKKTKSV